MNTRIAEVADEIPRADPLDELAAAAPPRDDAAEEAAVGASVAPLAVSGIVITKAALLAALQVYMPQLVDLAPIEGERYYLAAEPIMTTQPNQQNGETDG